jgi:dephospho-CoA kinase
MIKVGITGGIGSGKTTVCKIFETLGIPVYYADDRAKWLMTFDKSLKNEIKSLFGKETYFRNGRLNRKYLANIVFHDKTKLNQLNALVHPAVANDGEQWFQNISSPYGYALKEAALMIESNSHLLLDKLILVTASKENKIARVIKRDKSSRAEIIARIDKQLLDSEKSKYADYIINNDGETGLIEPVMKIHYNVMNK